MTVFARVDESPNSCAFAEPVQPEDEVPLVPQDADVRMNALNQTQSNLPAQAESTRRGSGHQVVLEVDSPLNRRTGSSLAEVHIAAEVLAFTVSYWK